MNRFGNDARAGARSAVLAALVLASLLCISFSGDADAQSRRGRSHASRHAAAAAAARKQQMIRAVQQQTGGRANIV